MLAVQLRWGRPRPLETPDRLRPLGLKVVGLQGSWHSTSLMKLKMCFCLSAGGEMLPGTQRYQLCSVPNFSCAFQALSRPRGLEASISFLALPSIQLRRDGSGPPVLTHSLWHFVIRVRDSVTLLQWAEA